MIHKEVHDHQGETVMAVTFTLPSSLWVDHIHLVGDFNDWSHHSHPLQQDRSGSWTTTVPLEMSRAYQFRYLIDNHQWTNDDNADAYVRNIYGTDNFVVFTDINFQKYNGE
ncbi:MAG: isoamylase early set domain-containing protein [Chloroflexota bacterium]